MLSDEPRERRPADPGGEPSDRSPAAEAVAAAVRYWWISVLRGCLALCLGIGALISGASEKVLVNYIGVYWLLSGVLTARWAHGVRWRAGARIGLAAGVLGIGTGLLLLARHALDHVVSRGGPHRRRRPDDGGDRVSAVAGGVRGRGTQRASLDDRRAHPGVRRGLPRGRAVSRQRRSSVSRAYHDRRLGPGCGHPADGARGSDAAPPTGHRMTARCRSRAQAAARST